MIKQDIDELMKLCNNVDDVANDIRYTARRLYNKLTEYDSKVKKENPYIIKHVLRHVADGVEFNYAVDMTAAELGLTTSRVETLFKTQKVYYSALNLYAKKYMAEKLKSAGLAVPDIARLIGISNNHVYKLLNCKCNLWILSGFRACG